MCPLKRASAALRLAPAGKRLVAQSLYSKGKSFVGAALLLRRSGGYEYVVLHLICQGAELILKGVLLILDYDKYEPKLKKYGHDLEKLARETLNAFRLKPLRGGIGGELGGLNKLYKEHLLRYASPHDIVVDPSTIPSARVLRRIVAVIRLTDRQIAAAQS